MAGFKDLKGQGHAPTLFMAFLYFDMSFMVWTMLGPLSTEIAEALALAGHIMTAGEKATLLSLPILSGAILRIVLGFGVDKLGAKTTALMSQIVVIVSLLTAFLMGDSITYDALLLVALGLGFAGAAFAVALPQAGQWYPPKLQGVVLGIAGAGNIGVVIDFLFAPKIAEIWGWSAVFGVGAAMAILVFIAYIFIAKNAPADVYTARPKKIKDYIKLLGDKDTWWFSLFYAISFGGFVGIEENNIQVDLFPEFDLDLLNYKADALIAIYSGSCLTNPPPPSGFKIGTSLTAENQEQVNNLAVCMAEIYQSITRLPFTYQIINPDHASYHIFRDIAPTTPAILIEIGSLSTDRQLITRQSNVVVDALSAGITCFLENTEEVK